MRRSSFATRFSVLPIAVGLAIAGTAFSPQGSRAATGDIGYEGPSFAGASGAVTGEKPESKLWFNDGAWWASMWSANGGYTIHRLDIATQAWADTGTALDPRSNSRADALWAASTGKLFVASHVYSSSGSSTTSANSARLYRYSYSASNDQYTLDAGFPVTINAARSESLTVDRDSTGQLWITWVQGNQVWVNRSLCNPTCDDAVWGSPFVPAVNAVHPNSTTVSSDDISSLASFGGRVGLMWGNQAQEAWYFAIHDDTAADTVWGASQQAFQGNNEADDHVNLATLQSDGDGRVYVAVKTSINSSNQPTIKVLERSPVSGTWLSHTVSTGQYGQTRPIVLVDETAGVLHVFSSDESGGGVYHKATPLSNIHFADGKGALVMWDQSSQELNDASSTKQIVSRTSGLVVLASNNVTDRYWHSYDALTGVAPVASFTAAPRSGAAPLVVSFTDTSTNAPTSWAWDFDSNGSIDSTERNPVHTYAVPGSYSVTLTATNLSGTDTETQAGYVVVGGGTGGATATFTPAADAKVSSSSPTRNFGTSTDLRVRTASSNSWNSYLRFNVTGLSGTITSATLRLFVTASTASGGGIYRLTPSAWAETGITWANAPPITGSALDTRGAVTAGTWVEWNVSSAVTGNGVVELALRNAGGSGTYSSREGANRPQLVVNTAGDPPPPQAPVAGFSGTPTSGSAPLVVSFTDASTNAPTSWAWDFDDDGTVDSTAQHPQHTYSASGTYSVTLTATNASGSDSDTRTNYVVVGTTQPPPPVAGFSGTPTSGTAPLVVSFADTSTNSPTSWAWDFDGNGTTDSTSQSPQYTYTTPGTYSVTLTVTNAGGSDSETRSDYVVVGGGGTGGTATFAPAADAKVSSDNPTKNYGTVGDLRVRTASTNSWNSYLRFNLTGLSGVVTSATLRMFVTASTASGGGIHALTPTSWAETGITWANAPTISGTPLDTRAAVTAGTWVEWDVTSAVTGNGVYELALRNSGGSGTYSSREGANPPQLVIVTGG